MVEDVTKMPKLYFKKHRLLDKEGVPYDFKLWDATETGAVCALLDSMDALVKKYEDSTMEKKDLTLKPFTARELMEKKFPPVTYEEAWEGSEIMNQPGMKEKHGKAKNKDGSPRYLPS